MNNRYLALSAAALLLAVACGKQNPEGGSLPNEMTFSASLDVPTRVSGSSFDNGDVIGVFVTQYGADGKPTVLEVGGNYMTTAAVTFDGATWSSSPKIYWDEGQFDVYAFYPRSSVNSIESYPFTVAADQSVAATGSMDPYEASDFLWAVNKGVSQQSTVPLVFSHKMSKVVIRLVKGEGYEGDFPTDATLTVFNTVTTALVDLSTGDVIKDPHAETGSVRARRTAEDTFEAILVPQMLVNRVPLFEIICGDVSYLLESKFNFRSGVCHTVNLTLSSNPEKVRIDIGGEIVGW